MSDICWYFSIIVNEQKVVQLFCEHRYSDAQNRAPPFDTLGRVGEGGTWPPCPLKSAYGGIQLQSVRFHPRRWLVLAERHYVSVCRKDLVIYLWFIFLWSEQFHMLR